MLIEFSVRNFLSIKNTATLSMVAASISEHPEDNTFVALDKMQLLKSAVLYGANASGKSNFINAFHFMRNMVLLSSKDSQASEKIPVLPFRLDMTSADKPTHFEIVFIENNVQYRYGIEATPSEVVSEWLFFVPTRKEARLFERTKNEIVLGENFKEGRGLEDKTRNNALFLSVVAQFNGEISKRILSWFHNMNVLSGLQDSGFMAYSLNKIRDSSYKEKMLRLMQLADLDILEINLEASPITTQPQLENIAKQLVLGGKLKPEGGALEILKLITAHNKFDENQKAVGVESFDFDRSESEGTKKILALSAPVINTLQTGKVLVIDEFDARLHPLLTRAIVKLFNSKESNPKGAQLIFSTHDTNLLDRNIFRRDQIWFVEKNNCAASQLYSLVEYKLDKKTIRKDASYEKQYMLGKYGAIPFLGDFEALFNEAEAK